MTSRYSTRSRGSSSLHQPTPDLFNSHEMSPKTTVRASSSSLVADPTKTMPAFNSAFLTTHLSRSKRESSTNIYNQSDFLYPDPNSSSNNDSFGQQEKKKQSERWLDRAELNISSVVPEQNSLFGTHENDKLVRKKSDDVFINEKKSYRIGCHRRMVGVPYRKCHSTMEEKVVGIINKINSGKECHK